MAVHVQLSRSAAMYRDNLRGRDKARYQDWLKDLKSQGCAAMDYRLTGDFVDRFCMKHLIGPERAAVVFDSPKLATIVLLGPHDARNPDRDIYAQLYAIAGIPVPTGERTKPACCGPDGRPPDGAEVAAEMAERVAAFVKSARRRRGRR